MFHQYIYRGVTLNAKQLLALNVSLKSVCVYLQSHPLVHSRVILQLISSVLVAVMRGLLLRAATRRSGLQM